MKKHRRNGIKHALATAVFCMVMSIGILCMADEKGTVTVASAKIRASADSSSEQLGSVAQGGTVDIISETTGADGKTWYQVYVDANTKGYIRADLVEKTGGSSTSTSNTSGSSQTTTTATPVDAKKGTVVTSNVRIRKGASTNHDVVATANRGMVVTVTGEADGADGKKWYQISFTYNNKEITGFIRSDLVTFDNVPADTAVSEITGEENNTETATEPVAEEPQEQPGQTEQTSQSSNDSANIILMNVDDVPYIMPGFVAVDLNWNDQKINAYKNGNFYIFYAQKQNGEEGWYLFDSDKGIYQRYAYTSADVTIPEEKGGSVGIIVVIILVIVIVILLAAVGLLFLKLREYTAYDNGYDDEDDEEYSDNEDFEELEELEDDEEELAHQAAAQLVRRPQLQANQMVKRPQSGPQAAGHQAVTQPVRRPQPQMSQSEVQPARRPQPQSGGQPARRPQPQSGMPQSGGQPTRRPQPQSGMSQSGGQPTRRPQPQAGMSQSGAHQAASQPARRPQPQGGMPRNPQGTRPQGQRPAAGQDNPQNVARRPQPQNDTMRQQKGYKAKNMLEHEDDDMDFMDI